MTADVADPHDVARLLSAVQSELPPLAGVIHAAGENSTTPLSSLDEAELDRVFREGLGRLVSERSRRRPEARFLRVHFFHLIGVGSYGQSAYSAANAYLDGLTWRLRERGVPAVSVNFGPLSTGMADAGARAQLELRGVHTLSPTEALTGMADVMAAAGSGTPEAVVARIDWSRFLPIYLQAGPRALLDEVAREVPASGVRPGRCHRLGRTAHRRTGAAAPEAGP